MSVQIGDSFNSCPLSIVGQINPGDIYFITVELDNPALQHFLKMGVKILSFYA